MELEIRKNYIPLMIILFLGILYVVLAARTQMLGEDEAVYYAAATDFTKGSYPAFTVTGRDTSWPPLIPLIYSFFFLIFGPSLGLAKVVIAIFGVGTVLLIYLMLKKYNIWLAALASILLLSIPNFTHFMFLSYVEIPIAFFSMLMFYIAINSHDRKHVLLAGLIAGLAYYVKGSGVILIPALFLYYIFLFYREKDRKYINFAFLSSIVAFAVTVPLFLRNFIFYKTFYIVGGPANFPWVVEASKIIAPQSQSLLSFLTILGYPVLFLVVIGLPLFLKETLSKEKFNKEVFLSLLLIALFSIAYIVSNFFAGFVPDPRYFSIIFPQVALLSAYLLHRMQEHYKRFLPVFIAVMLFAFSSTISTALGTASSQRFPSDYVEALGWINQNTPQDAIVFTTYTGSLKYFGDRNGIWTINEFPELMTTGDSRRIYDILKSYNVSHILIWGGTISQDYIIPRSNLLGAYTYNFLNVVNVDKELFTPVFSNQNNIIYALKS